MTPRKIGRLGFALSGVAAAISIASCGSRTELLPGQEECSISDDVRSCENACGKGEQVCRLGVWQECVVAPTSRACTNACGSGSERCEGGTWLGCDVPPATRPCTDTCGAGTETCENGRWQRCDVERVAEPCESVCGTGERVCERGSWRACNAPLPKPPKLVSTVRDFRDSHPDFERPLSGDFLDLGLVETELGPDDKPVYANKPMSSTTSGADAFDQWYRNAPMINVSTRIDLELLPSPDKPGFFVYDDDDFFPIDGQLFGNEGRLHNYHFTLEASTHFEYHGGELFRFSGDDDMWVFINRRLALDLGGIHGPAERVVDLDAQAAALGISLGNVYPLHFFFAERHTVQSHFTIDTSISEPGSCE